MSIHLVILIHFSIHYTVNTLPADGRKKESALQDYMITFALICPCMSWNGSGLYYQPLLRVVLGVPSLPLPCRAAPLHCRPTHLPFPNCVLMAPTMRRERISLKSTSFFGGMGKTVAIVCTNQKCNKKDIVPWALPFKVLIFLYCSFSTPLLTEKNL